MRLTGTDRAAGLNIAVPLAVPITLIFGLLITDNILLLAFLGLSPVMTALTMAIAITIFVALIRSGDGIVAKIFIPASTYIFCVAIAAMFLILGGEGRFLYANADWQIRDAVLRDMAFNPWPYVYLNGENVEILRAPIGMYLRPSLVGGSNQTLIDQSLLLFNTIFLGSLLATASVLFDRKKSKIIALVIFLFFSGLDVIGTVIADFHGGNPSWDHLERWLLHSQFSSHMTMIFWVPQHAIAGWTCALLFILWDRGLARSSLFLAAIPLSALWSPLAIMGAVPFALYAAIKTILNREIRFKDILIGAISIIVAVPALVYLRSGSELVASRIVFQPVVHMILIASLEVLPFIIFVWSRTKDRNFNLIVLLIITASLLLMPNYRIGSGDDFQMRASIIPLALLSYMVIETVNKSPFDNKFLLFVLSLGAITGVMEITRSVSYRAAPVTQCTLLDAWYQQTGFIAPTGSYLAKREAIPERLRFDDPKSYIAATQGKCWSRNWRQATG